MSIRDSPEFSRIHPLSWRQSTTPNIFTDYNSNSKYSLAPTAPKNLKPAAFFHQDCSLVLWPNKARAISRSWAIWARQNWSDLFNFWSSLMPGAKTPVAPTCSGPILRETLNNIRRTNQKMIRGHLQQEKTSKFHKMISREPNFYNRHFHSYF
jgi:hypothetical protein